MKILSFFNLKIHLVREFTWLPILLNSSKFEIPIQKVKSLYKSSKSFPKFGDELKSKV